MKNRFIIAGVIVLLISITSLAIWFCISLVDEKNDVILVNGELYYYENSNVDKRFLEQYISEGWYKLGEIDPVIDTAPQKDLQLRVAEGTVVSGSVYINDNYPDAVILSLEGSKPQQGINLRNPGLEGIHVFLTERLKDYTYIRYNNDIYKRQRNIGISHRAVSSLSEDCKNNGFCGYLTYDDDILSSRYSIPEKNGYTNQSSDDGKRFYMDENEPEKLYVQMKDVERTVYLVYNLVDEA